MKLDIYCDGGSRWNPGPAACAFVVYERRHPSAHFARSGSSESLAEILREKCGKYLGIGTNNEAEYAAVLEALMWLNTENSLSLSAIQGKEVSVDFYLDSLLVVNQFKGVFQVKDAKLRRLMQKAQDLERNLKQSLPGLKLSYKHIPREKNFQADELVNQTLDQELLAP